MHSQQSAPLYESLLTHVNRSKANFHVPGHKQGMAFDLEAKERFFPLLQIDLTEVGDLDDLHQAEGVIREAEELAAEAFAADRTFFLVGGTTSGNIAVILSLCGPGDMLLVQRSCHQSVFHGCLLAGAVPVFLQGDVDPDTFHELPISKEQLAEAIQRYPEIKGVVITSPSYFGVVQPLSELAEVCHSFGIPLIVDEAHGAHFHFHPDLPPSAMECNADVSIQSTHKMLTSMTMSSMLHIKGKKVSGEKIARWLRVIQSSSPSYPLLASLDLARRYAVNQGRDRIDQVLGMIRELREWMQNHLANLYEVTFPGAQDPFKLSLASKYRNSGFELLHWFEQQGIYAELADHQKVLFLFSIGTVENEIQWLKENLKKLDQLIPSLPQMPMVLPSFPLSRLYKGISGDEWRRRKRVFLPITEACGKQSAEMVVPYPPGIPLLVPGEEIRQEVIEFLLLLKRMGGKVRGLKEKENIMISVLEE